MATSGPSSSLPFRPEMEEAFSADLSKVQSFSGQGEAMGALGAKAAAAGDKVSFASSSPDKEVVAHEVAHVVQAQDRTPATDQIVDRDAASELEAHSAADAVMAGAPVTVGSELPQGLSLLWDDESESESESEDDGGSWFTDVADAVGDVFSGDEDSEASDSEDAGYQDAGYQDAGHQDADYEDASYEDADCEDTGYQDASYEDANYEDADYEDANYEDADYENGQSSSEHEGQGHDSAAACTEQAAAEMPVHLGRALDAASSALNDARKLQDAIREASSRVPQDWLSSANLSAFATFSLDLESWSNDHATHREEIDGTLTLSCQEFSDEVREGFLDGLRADVEALILTIEAGSNAVEPSAQSLFFLDASIMLSDVEDFRNSGASAEDQEELHGSVVDYMSTDIGESNTPGSAISDSQSGATSALRDDHDGIIAGRAKDIVFYFRITMEKEIDDTIEEAEVFTTPTPAWLTDLLEDMEGVADELDDLHYNPAVGGGQEYMNQVTSKISTFRTVMIKRVDQGASSKLSAVAAEDAEEYMKQVLERETTAYRVAPPDLRRAIISYRVMEAAKNRSAALQTELNALDRGVMSRDIEGWRGYRSELSAHLAKVRTSTEANWAKDARVDEEFEKIRTAGVYTDEQIAKARTQKDGAKRTTHYGDLLERIDAAIKKVTREGNDVSELQALRKAVMHDFHEEFRELAGDTDLLDDAIESIGSVSADLDALLEGPKLGDAAKGAVEGDEIEIEKLIEKTVHKKIWDSIHKLQPDWTAALKKTKDKLGKLGKLLAVVDLAIDVKNLDGLPDFKSNAKSHPAVEALSKAMSLAGSLLKLSPALDATLGNLTKGLDSMSGKINKISIANLEKRLDVAAIIGKY